MTGKDRATPPCLGTVWLIQPAVEYSDSKPATEDHCAVPMELHHLGGWASFRARANSDSIYLLFVVCLLNLSLLQTFD